MSPQPSYGPISCSKAPKNSIDVRKEIPTVEQMITANFWKVVSTPPKRANPAPKVVTVPEKILTPISV